MDKREKTILIWVLSFAGMLLLLLYSPWGSPDLYTKKIYFAENQGVNFKFCDIKNSPKSGHVQSNYENNEIAIEDYYSERNKQVHSSGGYNSGSTVSSSRIISMNNVRSSGSFHALSSPKSSEIHTGSTSSGGGSMSGNSIGTISNSGNKGSGSSPADTGMTSTTVDLSLFGDSTVLLASNTAQKVDGYVDPNGDPINEPIPIPEGWSFLFLLTGVYAFIKFGFAGKLLKKFSLK
jgi:hypothetical protein